MTFQHPHMLWLCLIPALLVLARRKRGAPAIPFPGGVDLRALPVPASVRISALIPYLQIAAALLAIAALARPQLVNTRSTVTSRGVDIAIAVDLSSSMLAVDRPSGHALPPGAPEARRSRLAVAKSVLREFVSRRGGDRLSIVGFAARAYPVAPLTLDHDWLLRAIERLSAGAIEDGTALGDGLLAAVSRLRSSPTSSRAVIIMTDGRSNTGSVSPSVAASAAAALGIRVHAIGIGGKGGATFPVDDPLGGVSWREVDADLDEPTLSEVAAVTGGSYFRAESLESLKGVFREIDRLEKRKIEERKSRSTRELFPYFVLPALFLMMAAQALLSSRFRRLP